MIVLGLLLVSCATREVIREEAPEQRSVPETYSTPGIMHFMYGEIYRMDGNLPYANMEYRRALEYDTSATILNAIAETYQAMGKHQLATEFFERSLLLESGNPKAVSALSDLYFREKSYEKAVPLLEKQREESPENLPLLQKLADSYRRIGDYDNALHVLDEMIRLEPDIPWSYIFAAETMFEAKRAGDAAPYLEKVLQMIPPNDELFEFWVRALYEKRDIPGMLRALKAWVDTKPESLSPYFLYLDQLSRADMIDEMEDVLSNIGHRWREDAKISYFQGLVAMAGGDKNAVWFYFERADGLPGAEADLYMHYGLWFWGQGEPGTAERIADRAIARLGPEARWLHMKAMIRAQEKDYDAAETYLHTLLSQHPGNINAREDLANIYMENGKYGKADSLYAELLADDPGNSTILNNYAYTLALMNMRLDYAMQLIDKALKEHQSAAYYDTKAWIYFRQEKYRRALSQINRALRYPDANSEVHYHHGLILLQLRRTEQARTALERSLALDPQNTLAKRALEGLQ